MKSGGAGHHGSGAPVATHQPEDERDNAGEDHKRTQKDEPDKSAGLEHSDFSADHGGRLTAEAATKEAERHKYFHHIAVAHTEWQGGNLSLIHI